MNVDIIEPYNRLHLAGGVKISALKFSYTRLFIGFSNGDLTIMRASEQAVADRSAPKSVRSFRSFSEIKRLFNDNDQSQILLIEKSFKNITVNQSAITALDILPLYKDTNREVLILGNSDVLQVFEWVGSHMNLIKSFDMARNYSTFGHMETDSARLLFIGVRKRLLVFSIVQKSRNVFDFNLVKEILLKERIRTITCNPETNTAILGLHHSFVILDASESFNISELPTDESSIYLSTPGTSFGYFGFSSVGPEVKIIPCGDGKQLIVRDSQVGILHSLKEGFQLSESNISLTSVPIDAAFLYPCYALFLYGKKMEVVDIESGEIIQEFHHQLNSNNIVLSTKNEVIVIGSGSYVFQFNLLPYQKQLDQFLSIRGTGDTSKSGKDPNNDLRLIGLNQALGLVTNLDASDDFFQDRSDTRMSNSKVKQLFLRDLYKSKALILLESYSRYHEALVDIASEWVLSCKEILHSFPDFLNADILLNGLAETTPPKSKTAMRRVSVDDILISRQGLPVESATGSELRAGEKTSDKRVSSDPPADSHASRRLKKFTKAVGCLIIYLTDQRRIHLSFLNSSEEVPSISWKGVELNVLDIYPGITKANLKSQLDHLSAVIDTSLFLCYFYTKPMLLGPLLRLPNNKCDAKVVNDCLLKNLHTHTQELQNFMRELLDFYFGRKLHADALKMLKSLAHETENKHADEIDEFLSGPALTINYLQRLTNDDLSLVCKYAAWVITEDKSQALKRAQLIFMNDTYECESYDNFVVSDFLEQVGETDELAIRYLEWSLFESDVLESSKRRKTAGKLATKLCLFYLRALKSLDVSDSDLLKNAYYTKLHNLLDSNSEYDPWTVLREIPTNQDRYLRLTIFIYKRLGEHQKSVDILFNQLADLDGAMVYCSEVYNQPHMQKEGTRLLHKLLEDLVMHYEENQDLVAKLLKIQGSKMSMLEILTVLPDSFPLHKLLHYIEEQVRISEDKLYNTRVAGQLYKLGSAKIKHNLLKEESEFCMVNSGNQKCNICGERLGYSVLCLDKDKHIVHYGCLKTARS